MIPNLLIKINKSLKEAYENFIDNLVLGNYFCPHCKAKGKMNYHAEYDRKVITLVGNQIVYEKLSIVRLKCYSCNRTHALLPNFLIPYQTHGYTIVMECLFDYINGKSLFYIYDKYGVSPQLLYSWIKKFKLHSERVCILLKSKIKPIKQIIKLIYVFNDLWNLLTDYFNENKCCFMQIIRSSG
ncbi:MAG: ISChy3, orf1 [Haloplasmataceae bacterium]|jgi:hypothetical protein|nr:ISChy3, orf1 [Haloplasmataceae bacterium]